MEFDGVLKDIVADDPSRIAAEKLMKELFKKFSEELMSKDKKAGEKEDVSDVIKMPIETGVEEEETDFTGMSSVEVAEYVNKHGFKVQDLQKMLDTVEKDSKKEEEEHREECKSDWMKFYCHIVDVDLGMEVTDLNNYDGRFYSKAKCMSDARKKLKEIYDNAHDILYGDFLYETTLDEIMDFAEERFECDTIHRMGSLVYDGVFEMDNFLNLDVFRKEVEDKLRKIRKHKIKDFNHYYGLIEYDSVNGDLDGISAALDKMRVAWNYNGYEAYTELEKDCISVAAKYAKKATEIARTALRKRIEIMKTLREAG